MNSACKLNQLKILRTNMAGAKVWAEFVARTGYKEEIDESKVPQKKEEEAKVTEPSHGQKRSACKNISHTVKDQTDNF